ncbi:MAG: translation initiation factor IF-3 [Myxococcales bacterium]|nr:translation initiation factor IF-3 [Myxococcales bacterium]
MRASVWWTGHSSTGSPSDPRVFYRSGVISRHNSKDSRTDTPRVNRQITIPQIRVIGPDGDQLGIMSPRDAMSIAYESGLDLVEVAPKARPPVCRIMDYGKYRYQQSKRKSSSKSAQVEIKTIRLGAKTDTHDLETKLRKAETFLSKGNKVKLELRMRGREQAHAHRWSEKLLESAEQLSGVSTMTQRPNRSGRMITAMLEPLRNQNPNPNPKESS